MIENSLSRRSFLAGAGIVTGAAVVAAGTSLIKPKSAEAAIEVFPWPYPTAGLNVTDVDNVNYVTRRGYDYYHANGGCMSGTGRALIQCLIDAFPETTPPAAPNPDRAKWLSFPLDLFKYGAGGVNSWGTICGAIHGAVWVLQAFSGATNHPDAGGAAFDVNGEIDRLLSWYCGNTFPSMDHDGHLKDWDSGAGTRTYPNQPTSVANSPLCHASVTNWCHDNSSSSPHVIFLASSEQKKDRCAKVAGDVARMTAKVLNYCLAGIGTHPLAAFTQPDYTPAATSCSGCHVGTTAESADNAERVVWMKSTCTTQCHTADRNPCTRP